MPRTLLLLVPGLLVTALAPQPAAAPNENAALTLHLLPVTINGFCTRPAARPACNGVVTAGRLSPTTYFAYVLVTGANATLGVAGVEFGINYNGAPGSGVDVFNWRNCGTLEFAQSDWPNSGSGNVVTWDPANACQRQEPGGAGSGVVTNVGYFYLAAYSADQLTLTVRPASGLASIADCDNREYTIAGPGFPDPSPRLGYAAFSAGGQSPGFNPCVGFGAPLSCGITGPEAVPGNSMGTLYTVTASRPGATFNWSIGGAGTLTVLPPGHSALVDASANGSFTLSVDTSLNGEHSRCERVVTVMPGACAINGPGSIPSGSSAIYQIGGVLPQAAIAWSVFGSGGIVGPASGTSVTVSAGAPGLLTVRAAVTVAAITDTCSRRIDVTATSCAVIGPDVVVAGSTGILYTAVTDAAAGHFAWTVTGAATISAGGGDEPSVTITAGSSGTFNVAVQVTGDGVTRDCGRLVSIIPPRACPPSGWTQGQPAFHLVPVTGGVPCDGPNAAPNCSNIRTNGGLDPHRYFAFLLITEVPALYGVTGMTAGIDYHSEPGQGIEILAWTLCANQELPTPNWPAPGSGNRILWDAAHCQRREPGGPGTGVVAAAGYFYLAAYSPDRLSVITFPGAPHNEIVDCNGCALGVFMPGGSARFSPSGLELGLNPCGVAAPVQRTTWSAIKALHGR